MTRRTADETGTPAPEPGVMFPRMLTLEQVQEILNVRSPLVYALVRSGELRAAQFGGRGSGGSGKMTWPRTSTPRTRGPPSASRAVS